MVPWISMMSYDDQWLDRMQGWRHGNVCVTSTSFVYGHPHSVRQFQFPSVARR